MINQRIFCVLILILSSVPLLARPTVEDASSDDLYARIADLQNQLARISAECGGEQAMLPIVDQLNALYSQLPRDREGSLDQGGDNCTDAAPIDSLPYCDFGSTIEFFDDFVPPVNCGLSTAPDVVYSYTSPTNQIVSVSLCGSSFNTILYVWELCPGPPPANLVCCNNDGATCAPQSCCPNVFMRAGYTYYIIIDGAGSESGDYVLHVGAPGACPNEPCPPCSVLCPTGALAEGEGCPSGYPDNYNAGCFNYPFHATTLNCGETRCGTAFWGSHLDHDAYIVTITERDSLTWCISAEFDFIAQAHQYFSAG